MNELPPCIDATASSTVTLTRQDKQRRRSQLDPLNEVLLLDPIAQAIGERYIHGVIVSLVECLFQIAIHCSAAARASQARELEMIRKGFSMRHREF